MAQFRAKNDTFYNFQYVRKGKVIYGGDDLKANENFELIDDESKKVAAPATGDNGGENTPPAALAAKPATYNDLVKYAQTLNIAGANRMKKPELLEAIAKAEAETAAPTADDVKGDGEVNGDSVDKDPAA